METEHGDAPLYRCHEAGCQFVTNTSQALAAHQSAEHEAPARAAQFERQAVRNKRAQHKCARQCGFVTNSVIALRNHNAFVSIDMIQPCLLIIGLSRR